MPFIIRNEAGEIINATTQDIYGSEMVPFDHPDLLNFLESNGQNPKDVLTALEKLRDTDAAMVRAVEDVINALMKKGILKMSDLPPAVQDRMVLRIKLRLEIENTFSHANKTHSDNLFSASAETPE